MTLSSRFLSLHVLLLAIIFFSWGLLFLSVALPGDHAFKRDWKSPHSVDHKSQGKKSDKGTQEREKKNFCADCWSVLQNRRNSSNANRPFGADEGDAFYFFTLSSSLMSLRNQLRMARKVAGKRLNEIKDIECKVKNLIKKDKIFWSILKPSNASKSETPKNDVLPVGVSARFFVSNILSKMFATAKSSDPPKASLIPVPLPQVSVIVDGRDSNIDLLLNSQVNVSTKLMFYVGVDVSSVFLKNQNANRNIFVHQVSKNASRGTVYNTLMRQITTPYTLVAPDLRYFSAENKIHRLISILEEGNIWAVGGSILSPQDEWESGCLQSTFKNFKATFNTKTIAWLNGCHVCAVLQVPFLSLTPVLRSLRWSTVLPKSMITLDIFIRAFHYHHYLSASCSDSTFTLRKIFSSPPREEVIQLANVYRLKEIHLPRSPPVILRCDEMANVCREAGEIVSPCCLAELASMVKFFLSTCEAHGLFCELQEGSLLGAVKFGDILPWEKDADITFHTNNFSAIRELSPVFKKAGYVLKLTDNRWCCVNGFEAGGEGKLIGGHWMAELYGQHAMDSEEMAAQRQTPTKVELRNGWVRAPTNPGEFVRNRYGQNIYRHSQHWLDLGKLSGWEEYPTDGFTPCDSPGHHACLDLNPPDGVTHFRLPLT